MRDAVRPDERRRKDVERRGPRPACRGASAGRSARRVSSGSFAKRLSGMCWNVRTAPAILSGSRRPRRRATTTATPRRPKGCRKSSWAFIGREDNRKAVTSPSRAGSATMDGLIVLQVRRPRSTRRASALWAEGAVPVTRAAGAHPRALQARTSRRSSGTRVSRLAPASRARVASPRRRAPGRAGRAVPSVPALREPRTTGAAEPGDAETVRRSGPGPPAGRALEALLAPPARPARSRPLSLTRGRPRVLGGGRALDVDLLLRRRVAPTADAGRPRWRPVLSDPHERNRFAASPRRSYRRRAHSGAAGRPAPRRRPPARGGSAPGFLDSAVDSAARDVLRDVLPAERRRAGDGSPEALAVAGLAATPAPAAGRRRPRAPRGVEPAASSIPCPRGRCARDPRRAARDRRGRVRPRVRASSPPRRTRSPRGDAGEVWEIARDGRPAAAGASSRTCRTRSSRGSARAASLSPAVRRSLEERHPTGVDLSPEETWTFLRRGAAPRRGGRRRAPPGRGRSSASRSASSRGEGGAGTPTPASRASASTRSWTSTGRSPWATRSCRPPSSRTSRRGRCRSSRSAANGCSSTASTSSRPAASSTGVRAGARRSASSCASRAASTPRAPARTVDGVAGEGWLEHAPRPPSRAQEIGAFTPPRGSTGILRPYQMRGVAWLRFLLSRGLGACLADDMGLGKTDPVPRDAPARRAGGGRAHRPVAPRLPDVRRGELGVRGRALRPVARGSRSTTAPGARAARVPPSPLLGTIDLLVTTYALAHRDRALLSEVDWEYLTLDEAQNVKNPAAAQSRAVRALCAPRGGPRSRARPSRTVSPS